MVRILDRHVLAQWLQIFAIVTGATFGLLLLQALYDSFPDLLEVAASTGDMLKYYAILSPSFLSLVLPVSVLVSLLYALGQLHRHNEITAMRAAGIGLLRITRWIWVAALVLSGVLFYLNSTVIPWSVEQARLVKQNLRFAHQAELTGRTEEIGIVTRLAYHDRAEGRIWEISRYSAYSHRAFGVTVAEVDASGREVRRILAAEGFWDEVDGDWVLLRGQVLHFGAERGEVRAESFDRRVFPELHDDPAWMMLLDRRPKDLSLFELARVIGSTDMLADPRRPAYEVRYHALLAGTFSCLIVAGLAVPFAVSGVRVNPAVGVSKSIGLFFLYYILSTIGSLLGEQGAIAPVIAAWLPNAFMAAMAVWLMLRAR